MSVRNLLIVVTALIAFGPHSAADPVKDRTEIQVLSGEPCLLIVNGYSTSFQWPKVLQRKLDKYFDGKRVVEVRSAVKGSTPIAKWMDTDNGKPLVAWIDILRPALGAGNGRPIVVLAQQSLQWAFGERTEGIRGIDDQERITEGVKILKRYTDLLLREGADEVFLSTHIYKSRMEPAIGNERLALAEFLATKPAYVHAGPDVWRPMNAHWPQAFAADRVHPNAFGAEIIAHSWFKALLKHGDLEIPTWSQEEMAAAGASSKVFSQNPRRSRRASKRKRDMSWQGIAARHDRNRDGKITREEFRPPSVVFARLDRSGNGVLTKEDFGESDGATPLVKRAAKIETTRNSLGGLAGELYPDYSPPRMPRKYGAAGVQPGQSLSDSVVYALDGKETNLASLWKKQPAVLLTASITCGPSCRVLPNLKPLSNHFGDKLSIGILYVLESHPFGETSPYYSGGRANIKKRSDGETYRQPKNLEERLQYARKFNDVFKPSATMFVDGMKNDAWKMIGEGPNIGLLINQGGVVAHKQGWFDAAAMVQYIEKIIKP